MRVIALFLATTIFILASSPAYAITLDTFEGVQSVSSFGSSGVVSRSSRVTSGAIGGVRSLDTVSNGGNPALTITATTTGSSPFVFDHSQTGDITGITNIHWDGNTNAASIDFTGLGGIDLTEDGGDSFLLKELFYDFPDSKSTTISIQVFDAGDGTGNTFSRYDVVLARAYSFEDILVSFATPTSTGPSGAADITNVGAVLFTINGSNPAVDLIFETFATNGPCELIPGVGGKVLDECGECIPPSSPDYNQSCVDCLGVPNGDTLPGDSCDTGELGPCAPGIYDNDCDCERVNDPVVERCDGADNNCNGEIDEIFPQIGTSCGVSQENCEVNGTFICDDNGGVKCDIDFAQAILDDCDIDIGCDGVPGSGLKPDDCGICGGDGSTCGELGCDSVDISELLFQLDGGAKEQEALIRSITKIIKRNTRKKRLRQFVEDVRVDAHQRQIENWILSWTLPIISVQCESILAAEFCVFNDNTIILNDYIAGSEGLRDLGLDATKKLRRVTRNKKLTRRWRKRLNNRHNANLEIAAQVPETQAVCTSPSQ